MVKARIAKQTEGRRPALSRRPPQSALWLVGWLVGWLVLVILPAYTGYEDGKGCSETSANKIYSPGNYQRERTQSLFVA
jgi:hypothetical protein